MVWMGWLVGILLPEIRPKAEDCACFWYGVILYRPLGNRRGRLPDGWCRRCGCSLEGGDDSLIEDDQQRSQFFWMVDSPPDAVSREAWAGFHQPVVPLRTKTIMMEDMIRCMLQY